MYWYVEESEHTLLGGPGRQDRPGVVVDLHPCGPLLRKSRTHAGFYPNLPMRHQVQEVKESVGHPEPENSSQKPEINLVDEHVTGYLGVYFSQIYTGITCTLSTFGKC